MKTINIFIRSTIFFDTKPIWSTLKTSQKCAFGLFLCDFYFKHVADDFFSPKFDEMKRIFLSFHKFKVFQIMILVSNYYLFSNGVTYKVLTDTVLEKQL